jgi:hypothetical protein
LQSPSLNNIDNYWQRVYVAKNWVLLIFLKLLLVGCTSSGALTDFIGLHFGLHVFQVGLQVQPMQPAGYATGVCMPIKRCRDTV